jgi:hypothetical protein
MTMKLVPKPEGYELRDKRSTKAGDCELWEPRDALYCAHEEMVGKQIDCVNVIWRERDGNGKTVIRQRRAGSNDAITSMMVNSLGDWMGWKA